MAALYRATIRTVGCDELNSLYNILTYLGQVLTDQSLDMALIQREPVKRLLF